MPPSPLSPVPQSLPSPSPLPLVDSPSPAASPETTSSSPPQPSPSPNAVTTTPPQLPGASPTQAPAQVPAPAESSPSTPVPQATPEPSEAQAAAGADPQLPYPDGSTPVQPPPDFIPCTDAACFCQVGVPAFCSSDFPTCKQTGHVCACAQWHPKSPASPIAAQPPLPPQWGAAAAILTAAPYPLAAAQAYGDGIFAAPWSCAAFINCGGGYGAVLTCPKGTLWDTGFQTCNWPSAVDCGSRPV